MAFDPNALPVPDLGLRCLRCGYGLAGLPSHQCPECGRRFTLDEYIPVGDFPVVIFLGKELRGTPQVLALLKRYGLPFINVLMPGETVFGLAGPGYGAGRIGVPRSNYFEAIDLLRRQALGEEMPAVEATPPASEWMCATCGEQNPGNFEICWNCGKEREPA